MAWVREKTATLETNLISELDEVAVYGTTSMITSSTKAHAGTYSARVQSENYPRGLTKNMTKIRSCFWMNHSGAFEISGYYAIISLIKCSGITDAYILWNGGNGNIELYINGVMKTSVAKTTGGFNTVNTWRKIGITYYANSSSGFYSMYLNDTKILTWSGNTGTGITGVYFGGSGGFGGWQSSAYVDSFYVDSDSAVEADASPPDGETISYTIAPSNSAVNIYSSASIITYNAPVYISMPTSSVVNIYSASADATYNEPGMSLKRIRRRRLFFLQHLNRIKK